MQSHDRLNRFLQTWLLPSFLVFALLWKGGKSLESTWLFMGITWMLLMLLWQARRLHTQKIPMPLWLACFAFLGWTVLSYSTSSVRNYGLDELLRDGSSILLLFWVARSSTDETLGLFPRLVRAIVLSAIAASILGIAVYLFQPVERFVGSFFDFRFNTDYWPNAWGDFVLLSWPLVLWWTIFDAKAQRRTLNQTLARLPLLGGLLGCFFLSYSRGSILAFGLQLGLLAIAVVLTLLLPAWQAKAKLHGIRKLLLRPLSFDGLGKGLGLGIPLTILVAIGVFFGVNEIRSGFFSVQSVIDKATFSAAEGTSSIDERAQFWESAATLSRERPFFGWGPYSFRFVQPRLQQGVFATSDHPHNIVLKMALERGWPAAGLYLLILALLFLPILIFLRRSTNTLQASRMMVLPGKQPLWKHVLLIDLLAVALLGTLAHQQIDYNLQFVGNAVLFWSQAGLLLAFLLPEYTNNEFSNKAGIRWQRITEVVVASALMILAVLEARYLVTSSLGRHAEAAGDTATALAWYEESRLEWYSRDMHLSRATLLLKQGEADAALFVLDDFFAVNKEDARAWLLLGQAYVQNGNHEDALGAYRAAYALGKLNYLSALQGVVEQSIALNKRAEIDARRTEYDGVLTAFADAIQQNIHFVAMTPNVETLAVITKRFGELYPADKAFYGAMAAKATAHAAEERQRLSARKPGLLW